MKDTVTEVLVLVKIGQHILTQHCGKPTQALVGRDKGRKSNGWSLEMENQGGGAAQQESGKPGAQRCGSKGKKKELTRNILTLFTFFQCPTGSLLAEPMGSYQAGELRCCSLNRITR